MKSIKYLLAIIIAIVSFQTANAQSNKSERTIGITTKTIKVSGADCEMTKSRIEKTAYTIDGIQSAKWNEDAQVLTITYSVFKKDAPTAVQKKLALAGQDTELFKASDASFNELPDCCKYKRKS